MNDLLLLSDQFPLSEGFFNFFLSAGKTEISFEQFLEGIVRFQGFAVLCFGNVRFAYRTLSHMNESQIFEALNRFGRSESSLTAEYTTRRKAPALPAKISANQTWFLGYIASSGAMKDLACYTAMSVMKGLQDEKSTTEALSKEQSNLYRQSKARLTTNKAWEKVYQDVSLLTNTVAELRKNLQEIQVRGWLNTSHYLSSDYMDVYVATSMREKWEFEDVNRVVDGIFGQPSIRNLKLRYFDPTQSYLSNRIDKGLVEALMLKRATCTVYLVQETDTLGKDSELACTLAQGKPVIAFVPEINPKKYAETAYTRPMSYLQKRLGQLCAEGKIDAASMGEVHRFLETANKHQPAYSILTDQEEVAFVKKERLAGKKKKMCKILAEGEKKLLDSRADTLQKRHPLAVQVDLQTGVANGVLVVRNETDCARLLKGLFTNSLEFTFDREREPGITSLVEGISDSPFRVITDNGTITAAFWSRYLKRKLTKIAPVT